MWGVDDGELTADAVWQLRRWKERCLLSCPADVLANTSVETAVSLVLSIPMQFGAYLGSAQPMLLGAYVSGNSGISGISAAAMPMQFRAYIGGNSGISRSALPFQVAGFVGEIYYTTSTFPTI